MRTRLTDRLHPRLRQGREATDTPPAGTLLHRLQHPGGGRRWDAGQRGWKGVYVPAPGATAQPVVVKVQIRRPGMSGHTSWSAALRQHLDYLQRDGVAPDGTAGALYSQDATGVTPAGFLGRSGSDARQFRVIVSAARGHDLDLTPVTRALMQQVEADLGTRLDWVAVNHYDTAHPHTHVLVRGVDDRGQPLAIQRHYLAQGLRARAQALVTQELGPRVEPAVQPEVAPTPAVALAPAWPRDRALDLTL